MWDEGTSQPSPRRRALARRPLSPRRQPPIRLPRSRRPGRSPDPIPHSASGGDDADGGELPTWTPLEPRRPSRPRRPAPRCAPRSTSGPVRHSGRSAARRHHRRPLPRIPSAWWRSDRRTRSACGAEGRFETSRKSGSRPCPTSPWCPAVSSRRRPRPPSGRPGYRLRMPIRGASSPRTRRGIGDGTPWRGLPADPWVGPQPGRRVPPRCSGWWYVRRPSLAHRGDDAAAGGGARRTPLRRAAPARLRSFQSSFGSTRLPSGRLAGPRASLGATRASAAVTGTTVWTASRGATGASEEVIERVFPSRGARRRVPRALQTA